jgi:hypothetical protein
VVVVAPGAGVAFLAETAGTTVVVFFEPDGTVDGVVVVVVLVVVAVVDVGSIGAEAPARTFLGATAVTTAEVVFDPPAGVRS